MTIYVLTAGHYSDYRIVAVSDDWQKAAALSEELRAERMRRFESLVDWAAIAGKE